MAEPDWLRVGNLVELRSDEPGYEGAWFTVKILRLFPSKDACTQASVEYLHFVVSEEPGSERCTEFARRDHLRPVPPALTSPKSWKLRDAVETMHNDAWWIGYIKRYNAKQGMYRVWYGHGQAELDIPYSHIRYRQNFVQPSRESPNGCWNRCRPMQNPAVWDRTEKTPEARTQPRVSVPAHPAGDQSDDSWDEQEDRRQKKPRLQSKSAPAKSRVSPKIRKSAPRKTPTIRIVRFPRTVYGIMAINPAPPKVAEQTIVCLTPGSSPPVADSPFHDSAISPGSDSQAQKPPANPESSPQARSTSSSSSSSRGSGSFNSSRSEGGSDDCAQSGNSENSEEDDSILMPTKIFPDFSNDERMSLNMKVYNDILTCFRNDSKGLLDQKRHAILQGIRDELELPVDFCRTAHCRVFGMPYPER